LRNKFVIERSVTGILYLCCCAWTSYAWQSSLFIEVNLF